MIFALEDRFCGLFGPYSRCYMPSTGEKYKHKQIYRDLVEGIVKGLYAKGQQLPSGDELAKKFSASRPTVTKALANLQKAGFVECRVGSGTYVKYNGESKKVLSFGLLIPGLGETEIFEPICGHITHEAKDVKINLIWGGSMSDDAEKRRQQIETSAIHFVQQKVDGVFFCPLELTSEKDNINKRIVDLFDDANIPVVLMDRDIVAFPLRSKYDLIGVDNYRIGYIMTRHLIEHGLPVIKFVARPFSAPTVLLRIAGFKEALIQASYPISDISNHIAIGDADDPAFAESLLKDNASSIGIVCANDTTAAHLMHTLTELGCTIPGQVAVVGIDDVKYAKYLRVPLTTYRQPCQNIAQVAISLMLSKISNPKIAPQTIYLDGELIIRKSCGCEQTSSSLKKTVSRKKKQSVSI